MLWDSITLFSSPSPSHCCTRPLKFAADCRLRHSARPSEEPPHNKPATSSSPHFRALSRLYSSSLESAIEESPRTRKALESSRSQFVSHCAASVAASIPCRREPNHLDHCKGFRNGCSTIQPSAPSRVARRTLAPGSPSRATIQPDVVAWTI